MSRTVYKSGTLVISSALFQDDAGTATDPTAVVVKYKLGGAAAQTFTYGTDEEVVRDAAGEYHVNFDTTGWAGPDNRLDLTQWTGTGDVQAIGDDEWEVEPPLL
jgi:hypothetical protein